MAAEGGNARRPYLAHVPCLWPPTTKPLPLPAAPATGRKQALQRPRTWHYDPDV